MRRERRSNLSKGLGHLKGPHSVHVGGNDGNAMVLLFGVAEHKLPLEVDLSRREGEGEGRGGGREEKRERGSKGRRARRGGY